MRLRAKVLASVMTAVLATTLGACSDGGKQKPVGAAKMAATLGPGEGSLSLVTLPGFVESGASDARVDWVTPFQEQTKCQVDLKVVKTAEDMTNEMRNKNRRYDGVAAPPEVAGRLISDHEVTPVNPNLIEGYKKLEPRLRSLQKRGDTTYGVPYVWGSNLLMYDTRAVQPAPTGWANLFDPGEAKKYAGRLVVRDSPLTIAEAALYLRGKNRKLKITDPYSLTRKQLDAAASVLAKQRPYVKEYWEQPADAVGPFAGGDAALGEVWPYQADVLAQAGRSVQAISPSEGVTGWTNAWMIGARVAHPNCMYQWMQWTSSVDVQQQVAEWSGAAPANPQACTDGRLKASFCGANHVGDRGFINKVIFAHTPSRNCGGGASAEGKRECTNYAEWNEAWIKSTKILKQH
ncbi:extracellular solute-binding protein [Actinomadura barringtoniae]|uniref:Extracellular solute-binding protein n=1 Tax=Actinomadura barringtoniae TaxID=1427535 RepID=A0A939P704_9ACTN|nr:extracellular solute-binding protein [Actinomadura barringtoniae]MBO2446832.1 extracellular solute-binding protein [Actinomadura barringtoniae]